MRDRLPAIRKLGAEVLLIEPHEVARVERTLRRAGLSAADSVMPILSDPSGAVSAQYGVALQTRIHIEYSNRPAAFVLDRRGIIRFAHIGRDLTDRADIGDLMQILQLVDKLGEPR